MYHFTDTPMEKFSDRPDRTVPHMRGENCADSTINQESDFLEPVLNPAHSSDFGKADRKDRT